MANKIKKLKKELNENSKKNLKDNGYKVDKVRTAK